MRLPCCLRGESVAVAAFPIGGEIGVLETWIVVVPSFSAEYIPSSESRQRFGRLYVGGKQWTGVGQNRGTGDTPREPRVAECFLIDRAHGRLTGLRQP